MSFDKLLQLEPYSLKQDEKEELLTERITELTEHHRQNCPEYGAVLSSVMYDKKNIRSYKDIPFLPVRLFKELSLKSVPDDEIVKTMTSSGTSGQAVSKIYLNRSTSVNQQKAMVKIVSDFTGSTRMPMLIIDCPSVVKDRKMFSARGAGILGFSIFGSKKLYALNDDMQLDVDGIREFLGRHKEERILIFGFTFMIWQFFYKQLVKLKEEGIVLDLSNAVMIHGGGWKKLISEAVEPDEFRNRFRDLCGLDDIHDYYGMVEQTGCIYMQCECGHLHASVFSDVITRRGIDFSECDIGERGIIQVVSSIPDSYPGHSLLTEDEGVILGEDDCPCGRKGKYFKVLGRLKDAEIRGCSDTFALDHDRGTDTVNDISEDHETSVLDKISYLIGNRKTIEDMTDVKPLEPFADSVMDFLADLSAAIMKDREAKEYPDVVTLGFWLRRASLENMKQRFTGKDSLIRLGRGVAFHIAPSNVPVNYAYTLFSGLLCGNANIVRVPGKNFRQVEVINGLIRQVLNSHEEIRQYISLVRYERNKDINDYLSSMCDLRVIWGGDETIRNLRMSPLPARATEIVFADRYSLAIIDSDSYMENVGDDDCVKDRKRIANDFYNDTYLTDQNACTSPRVVIWIGKQITAARELFWRELLDIVKQRYDLQPVQAVDKLVKEYMAAASGCDIKETGDVRDNRLVRMETKTASSKLLEYRGNSGYFYEYMVDDIIEVRELCDDSRCQTIGYYGNSDSLRPLLKSGIKGVDRVVPIGHTMDFDLLWDGYDLVERMTRIVVRV
ncbi:MAG: hypothetical protein IJT37_08240 [Lachnospiraceae bacterium]|nr:hypothetical protein [Lachnospiraceae bacterium]